MAAAPAGPGEMGLATTALAVGNLLGSGLGGPIVDKAQPWTLKSLWHHPVYTIRVYPCKIYRGAPE
jgi:hypothetical protein